MTSLLLPYQSGVLGDGMLGSMQLGESPTDIAEITTVYAPHPSRLIEIYDADMILCGVVEDYESFEYTENWYDIDTWTLQINRYKANVGRFSDDGYIRFVGDDGVEHFGIIEKTEKPLDSGGKSSEVWKISGRGIEAIFAQFPCKHGTLGFPVTGITFTFAASTTVTASASCKAKVNVGDYIYNNTDDDNTYAQKVSAISSDGLTITLESAYAGTAGSGKAAYAGTGYHSTPSTAITAITFTFADSSTVTASASCLSQVTAGQYIYNSTNDSSSDAIKISAISSDGLTITLVSAYAGTAGSGKTGTVCGCSGETALRQYVDAECISTTDAACVLPGLALATADQNRGSIVMRDIRFDYLSDVLYSIAKEASISFRLVHGTGLAFTFTVYTGRDVSDTVFLDPEYDNVKSFNFTNSLLEMKNVLYLGGSGDGVARLNGKVYSGTSEPSGWKRRAKFIDATDCSTAATLASKGSETLTTLSESLSLEMDYLPTSPTFVLGIHFKLGDIVSVLSPGAAYEKTRITSITTTRSSDGKSVKLGLGKDSPDLVSILKLTNKLNSTQQRH